MQKPYPLVYVEWVDSSGCSGWRFMSESRGIDPVLSIGWLIDDNDEYLTITAHVTTDRNQSHGALSIPKCAIRKRKTVLKPK